MESTCSHDMSVLEQAFRSPPVALYNVGLGPRPRCWEAPGMWLPVVWLQTGGNGCLSCTDFMPEVVELCGWSITLYASSRFLQLQTCSWGIQEGYFTPWGSDLHVSPNFKKDKNGVATSINQTGPWQRGVGIGAQSATVGRVRRPFWSWTGPLFFSLWRSRTKEVRRAWNNPSQSEWVRWRWLVRCLCSDTMIRDCVHACPFEGHMSIAPCPCITSFNPLSCPRETRCTSQRLGTHPPDWQSALCAERPFLKGTELETV